MPWGSGLEQTRVSNQVFLLQHASVAILVVTHPRALGPRCRMHGFPVSSNPLGCIVLLHCQFPLSRSLNVLHVSVVFAGAAGRKRGDSSLRCQKA